MAAARDQAARILRTEPETAGEEAAPESSVGIADTLRAHLSNENGRRNQDERERAPVAKPAIREAVTPAAKTGKRKTIFFGAVALLALASVSYGVHWFLVGRFHVS